MATTTTNYVYDKSGRMTTMWSTDTADATYFTYSQRDMATKILRLPAGGDATRTFTYNAVGERVVVDESGGTTPNYWTYDGYKLLTEKDNAGAEVRRYRHNAMPNERLGANVEMHSGTFGTCAPVTDQGGALTSVLNVEGNDSFWTNIFGEVVASVNHLGDRIRLPQELGSQALTTTLPFFVTQYGGVYSSRLGIAFGGVERLRKAYGLLLAFVLLDCGGFRMFMKRGDPPKNVVKDPDSGSEMTLLGSDPLNPRSGRKGIKSHLQIDMACATVVETVELAGEWIKKEDGTWAEGGPVLGNSESASALCQKTNLDFKPEAKGAKWVFDDPHGITPGNHTCANSGIIVCHQLYKCADGSATWDGFFITYEFQKTTTDYNLTVKKQTMKPGDKFKPGNQEVGGDDNDDDDKGGTGGATIPHFEGWFFPGSIALGAIGGIYINTNPPTAKEKPKVKGKDTDLGRMRKWQVWNRDATKWPKDWMDHDPPAK